jgi:hypothetical protein
LHALAIEADLRKDRTGRAVPGRRRSTSRIFSRRLARGRSATPIDNTAGSLRARAGGLISSVGVIALLQGGARESGPPAAALLSLQLLFVGSKPSLLAIAKITDSKSSADVGRDADSVKGARTCSANLESRAG